MRMNIQYLPLYYLWVVVEEQRQVKRKGNYGKQKVQIQNQEEHSWTV
jgi:hypothetical protein